jgi:hypothetical protein
MGHRSVKRAALSWGSRELQGRGAALAFRRDTRCPRDMRSGSLVFPAPSSTLAVTRLALEGFPEVEPGPGPADGEPSTNQGPRTLLHFAPLQSTSPIALAEQAASRGIRRNHPSIDTIPSVHSRPPVRTGRHRARGDHPRTSRSVLVVSHHLDGFLRSETRGLVASRCRSWGSPRFARSGRQACRSRPGRLVALPATRFTPPEGFPSPTAAPRHRGRCPLAVPPGRSSRLPMPPLPGAPLDAPPGPDGGFEALLRRRVRSAAPPLPATRRPILPWALFPFKVHFPPGPVP